jgi:integrase
MTERAEDTQLMAGLLSFIERETGITLHPENIDYFFEKWRQDTKSKYEDDGDPTLPPIDYAEVKVKEQKDLEYVDIIETSFRKWNRERNPVTLMVNDLIDRGCSKATQTTYRSTANTFMRMFRYEPEFTLSEYNTFMREAQETSLSVKRLYKSILKLLWEVQGLHFPVTSRRMHERHSIMPKKIPEFSVKEVIDIIKTVKQFGSPEDKFYFCLATVWAPRRIELGELSADNFAWNRTSGGLTFVPHKQQGTPNVRSHYIPEGLSPYLKDYSQKVVPCSSCTMSDRFWKAVSRLGLKVPKLSIRRRRPLQPEYILERACHKRRRGFGWHAFRHTLTSALVETGLNDTLIGSWIGWQSGNQAAPMVRQYYTPQNADEKVLKVHPFVKIWSNL